MTQPDRLSSQQIEKLKDEVAFLHAAANWEQTLQLATQLADTMRENEQLREAMLEAHALIAEGEIFEATAILKILGTGEDRNEHTGNP